MDADSAAAAGRETEFFTTLKEAQDSLENATHDSIYIHGGNDSWRREIESLKRELDEVEFGNR
jgi:hypothetical protein